MFGLPTREQAGNEPSPKPVVSSIKTKADVEAPLNERGKLHGLLYIYTKLLVGLGSGELFHEPGMLG
jgi:hypothetical protein